MADSITLVPSKLTLYRRTRSRKWQCRYKLKNGDWYRESTNLPESSYFSVIKRFKVLSIEGLTDIADIIDHAEHLSKVYAR